MRILILTILLIIANIQQSNASDFSVDIMAGYAWHPQAYSGYRDKTFGDNHTSDVLLGSINYKSLSLIGLSDSQGNFSTAFIGRFKGHSGPRLSLNLITGLYFLRTDNEPTIFNDQLSSMLPKISVTDREFTILPIIGAELDYKITDKISINVTGTMTFILTGIKFKL